MTLPAMSKNLPRAARWKWPVWHDARRRSEHAGSEPTRTIPDREWARALLDGLKHDLIAGLVMCGELVVDLLEFFLVGVFPSMPPRVSLATPSAKPRQLASKRLAFS